MHVVGLDERAQSPLTIRITFVVPRYMDLQA